MVRALFLSRMAESINNSRVYLGLAATASAVFRPNLPLSTTRYPAWELHHRADSVIKDCQTPATLYSLDATRSRPFPLALHMEHCELP